MKTLIALIAIFVASPVLADSSYLIETKIIESNSLIASPTLMVKPNVESSASVEGSYKLSIIASPKDMKHTLVKTNLEIGSQVHNPSVLVELGKETKVSMGKTSLLITVREA